MPPTRFSRAAGDHLEGHRDADQHLIDTVINAIQDRTICDVEYAEIKSAAAVVLSSARPLSGYIERQDQAFRMIQLISNTGGMTNWVDEQMRSMARDRAILPLRFPNTKEAPGASGASSCELNTRIANGT